MERLFQIGELAAATGLTVRTLHHYEEIGLLAATARTDAGYRLYGGDDVSRLYQIVALRQLGLKLEQVRAVLDADEDPRHVVKQHLEAVDRALELQGELRDRLRYVLGALERSEEPTADDFLEALEVMNRMEQYYTPEQLAQLEERRKQLGDEGMAKGQQDWADLIADATAAKGRGVDPASDEAQALVARWEDLISQFTGGDPGIRQSLQKMYETEGPEQASRGMVDPELMAFMGSAMEARPKGV